MYDYFDKYSYIILYIATKSRLKKDQSYSANHVNEPDN